jgi:3-phosphoshikimate 1-carboxyvinyltransferase
METYQPKAFFVESDWSAASYFYSIAILAHNAEIKIKWTNHNKIQGDAVIADIATTFGIQSTFEKQ